MPANAIYLFNTDFDLELANAMSPKLHSIIQDMEAQFLSVPDKDDILISSIPQQADFQTYLHEMGIELPQHAQTDQTYPHHHARAWGWTTSALERFSHFQAHISHPPISTVQKVNSKTYGAQLERLFNPTQARAIICHSLSEAQHYLNEAAHYPLVIKSQHGNSGIGLLCKQTNKWSTKETDKLHSMHTKLGPALIIEPWDNRMADISTRINITAQGKIDRMQHHLTLSGSAGVFFGIYLEPEPRLLKPWLNKLDDIALKVGKQLHADGYWGPVGIDGYLYQPQLHGNTRNAAQNNLYYQHPDPLAVINDSDHSILSSLALRPLVEINARYTMCEIAYSLQRKLQLNTACMLRYVRKKRHQLPENYQTFKKLLGPLAYNPQNKKGILLITPLVMEQSRKRPSRSGFFIAAANKQELINMHTELMKRVAK